MKAGIEKIIEIEVDVEDIPGLEKVVAALDMTDVSRVIVESR